MSRFVARRIPFRSIVESFSNSTPQFHGRMVVPGRRAYVTTPTPRTRKPAGGGHGENSSTMTMQMEIVDALCSGERDKASALLLNLSQEGKHLLRADDFLHILNYCARSSDPLFVMEAWMVMHEKEIRLNRKCSELMMRALCNGGYLDEAMQLINFLDGSDEPNDGSDEPYRSLQIYNIFLRACAKVQSLSHANQCLKLMERRMVEKNEVTYIQLFKLAVIDKNLSLVHELWKDYTKHYSPSIFPSQKVVWSFAKLGDIESAHEILQYMVTLVATFMKELHSLRLDIPIHSDDELGLKKSYPEVNEKSVHFMNGKKVDHVASADVLDSRTMLAMKMLTWSFNDLLQACAKLKNCDLAESLFEQMQTLGLQPTSCIYDGYIRSIVYERGFGRGIETLKGMHQMNLKPYDSTFAILSIRCSKAKELDLAEALLDQISEHSSPNPFNAFCAACHTLDQPEKAVGMLAKMEHLKVHKDEMTYRQLFLLFGNVNGGYEEGNKLSQANTAKRIKAIEMDMANSGIQHSPTTMRYLLHALGVEGMTSEMLHYLQVAENHFSCNNMYVGTHIYNTVLHQLVVHKEFQMAIEIFKKMKSCGFPVDAVTYDIMLNSCEILSCYRSACAIVSMMLRDGFCPQIRTYFALIKILLDNDAMDEALELLDQFSSEGNKLDISINSILSKACEKEAIDVVEFLVEWMHRKKICPNSTTCRLVFTTYVYCGFHSTAMEALQVLIMRMIYDKDGSSLENTKSVNNYIFSEDMEVESRILHHFKESEEDLGTALLCLRWCAMLGFPILLSTDQSPWAKRLSSYYIARKGAA